MSSISSVGNGLSAWLQQLQANQDASVTDPSSDTDSSSATSGTSASSATDSLTGASGGVHRHHHGGGHRKGIDSALEDQGVSGSKLSDLRTKIQNAVTSAKSSGQDVKSAVDGVLKDDGIDLDKFQQDLGAGGSGASAGTASADATSTSDATSALTASSTPSTSTSASIDSVLEQSGIDPSTFKQSLLSFLDSANSGGSTDTSSLFSGAQAGSQVDVLA